MYLLYAMLFIASFLLCAIFVALLLPLLKRMAKQPIYTEGPSWHTKKEGTPTMGGIAFLLSMGLCTLFLLVFGGKYLSPKQETTLLINTLFILLHGAIGTYDDLKKIKQRQNEGLTPKEKLIYQSILCILYIFARVRLTALATTITILGKDFVLGVFYYPLSLFVMLGIINCANLTDGIDGLASSVGLAVGAAFFLFYGSTFENSSVFSILLVGITLAFLMYNKHPAKIFMGDCGSLFLGATSICIAFSESNPFLILFVGGVYVIEGFSVVLQVLHFKKTKKRLFRMAPIHHHLELSGMKENHICLIGFTITLLLALLASFLR